MFNSKHRRGRGQAGRESEVGKEGEERGENREERSSYYLSGACYPLGYLVPGNLVFCFFTYSLLLKLSLKIQV